MAAGNNRLLYPLPSNSVGMSTAARLSSGSLLFPHLALFRFTMDKYLIISQVTTHVNHFLAVFHCQYSP
jgi:hypothetical protein